MKVIKLITAIKVLTTEIRVIASVKAIKLIIVIAANAIDFFYMQF